MIVEGVLKADVLSAIRPELYIVATPCVTANHGALVELTHGRPVLMAFDQLCGRPHNRSCVANVVMWPKPSFALSGYRGFRFCAT